MEYDELIKLLDEIHTEILLHPDAGTTRMDGGDFWNKFYEYERKVSEALNEEESPAV